MTKKLQKSKKNDQKMTKIKEKWQKNYQNQRKMTKKWKKSKKNDQNQRKMPKMKMTNLNSIQIKPIRINRLNLLGNDWKMNGTKGNMPKFQLN